MATIHKFKQIFSTAWRIFSFQGSLQPKWLDEDQQALVQYLSSSHGARLKALLSSYCSLREARACMAGGGPFEAGKAIGSRELLAYLEYLGKAETKDSEAAEYGDTADLGHLVP